VRTKAIIAALLLIGSVLPSVGARHLSAGYEDTVGLGAEESPTDPTVPQEAYERGVATEDCYESEGEISAEAAREATAGDAFCGELVYHQGTGLEQVGPSDQELLAEGIGGFDVHVANYMGTAIERFNQPFVDPVWQGVHDVGQELGLTDSADDADDEDGDRTQAYHVAVHYPFATHVVQSQTGAWEMNGPMSQEPYQAFVGFLYDDEGNPISGERLKSMIGAADIPDSAVPAVCGFEPFGDFAAINNIGSCGIELTYFGPRDSDTEFRSYDEECKSPAYVCSPASGGAWHGRIQCPATCTGNSEFNYEILHWVAGPVLEQDCNGRAPGFALDPKAGSSLPYMAHDLDVYSPTASAVEQASFPTTWTWANDGADTVQQDAEERAGDVLSNAPDLPGGPDLSSVDEAQTLVTKANRVEPNAEAAGALGDTSQSLTDDALERSITECQALTSSEEVDTVDDWVDIVDGDVALGVTGERSGSGLENFAGADLAGFGTGNDGLYLTSADHQDSANRPGPGTMWTEGKVGMFTDKNDDADYDQVFLGAKYQVDEIEETGAYPLLWDMWVEDTEPAPGQGCTAVGGATHTEMMVDAGYGADTGLAQLVYLNEPTTFVDTETGQTSPYPEGNTIFVLGSNAVHELWSPGDPTADSALASEIASTVADLQAYADAANGDDPAPNVVMPGEDLGLDSDFETQCREPTGGFTSALSFVHDCSLDCSGDTIATVYTFDVARGDGTLGGGSELGQPPVFSTENTDAFDFGQGQQTWVDVDPFDNDPDRNRETSSAPPTGE
jgi:hypothetical protein